MLKLQFRDQPGKFIKLSVSTLTLGRDESNEVVIDSPSVSDFHAEINTEAQRPWIVDLLSATGTYVNDQRVSGRAELKAWDVIRLGTVELEVTDPNSRRPDDWALRTESDLLASQFHTLQPVTVVGRDPACDLTIDSHLLSRRHAELTIEDDHLRIVDLESANGTYLNGEQITEGTAYPGDELRFDDQCFIVMGPTPTQSRLVPGKEDHTFVRGADADATVVAGLEETQQTGQVSDDTVLMPSSEDTLLFVPPPPPALLTELNPQNESCRINLDADSVRVGRSEDCDIVLQDKSVSKQHAEFSFADGAWSVRDLGASNPVMVNGEPVDEARLAMADRVQLGRMTFEFSMAGASLEEPDPVTMVYVPPLRASETGHSRPLARESRWLLDQLSRQPSWVLWLGAAGLATVALASVFFLTR